MNKVFYRLFFTLTLMIMVEPASAHHVMAGALPKTFSQGLLSGFGHPVIGIDHFAFILAVGLASAFRPNRMFSPLIFVTATVVGCLFLVYGYALPAAEILVAASVALLGALVLSGYQFSTLFYIALLFVAGIFHGYAYGEGIVGAENTPLTAYLIGFALILYLIVIGTFWITRSLWAAASTEALRPRLAGAITTGIGMAFLVENVESVLFV